MDGEKETHVERTRDGETKSDTKIRDRDNRDRDN